MSFADDVKRFELKATEKIDVTARQVAMELFSKIIKKTPVGNPTLWKSVQAGGKPPKGYVGGRARGNWQANIGPESTAVATESIDDSGDRTIGAMLPTFSQWKPSGGNAGVIWLGNALPYIIRLEYDAWSSQARAGMVRVSLGEIRVGGVGANPVPSPGGVQSG